MVDRLLEFYDSLIEPVASSFLFFEFVKQQNDIFSLIIFGSAASQQGIFLQEPLSVVEDAVLLLCYLLLQMVDDLQQLFGLSEIIGRPLLSITVKNRDLLFFFQSFDLELVVVLGILHVALKALHLDKQLGFIGLPLLLVALPDRLFLSA